MEANQQEIKNLEGTEVKNIEQEVEEDEPLDEETLKALKNLNVEDAVFTSVAEKNSENNHENNKKTSAKQKKNKKGQDFMEYAKNNGIDLKIQYDEGERNNQEYQNRKHDNNYQSHKGAYQNNRNFTHKKFTPNNVENTDANTNINTHTAESTGNYYNKKKNFGSYQNNYNKKPYNTGNNKNFHTVNKFDTFNAPQYENVQNTPMGFYPYSQNQNGTNPPTQNTNQFYGGKFNNFNQTGNEAEIDLDSLIVNSLVFYFSEKNLNNNHYMRTKLDSEGYLSASDLVQFNKMKQYGVTVEKVKEALGKNTLSESIEVSTDSEGEIKFRLKNWEDVRDRVTPIEVLQQRKNFKKFQHNNPNPYFNNMNYVGMQNNYFYQMNPHHFDPHMMNQQMMAGYGMGVNPGYLQYSQFQGLDMKMMNFNMYQGNMTGNLPTENTENINN